jgi:hypothetical protein
MMLFEVAFHWKGANRVSARCHLLIDLLTLSLVLSFFNLSCLMLVLDLHYPSLGFELDVWSGIGADRDSSHAR